MVEEEKQAASAEETTEELSILDEIVHATKIQPTDEAYDVTKKGVEALIAQLLEPGRVVPKISKAVVDDMIAEIDKKLSLQLDAVMHHPEVQKLESAWRSLKFFVDRTDFRENIKLEVINISKEDLLDDFEDAPEVPKSGLYKTVYTAEYGQFGGQPYATLLGNYDFGPGPQDVKLLQYVASLLPLRDRRCSDWTASTGFLTSRTSNPSLKALNIPNGSLSGNLKMRDTWD